MFWKRTTTTTDSPIDAQYSAQAAPPVQYAPVTRDVPITRAVPVVPVVAVTEGQVLNPPTYSRPYEPIVPVPVASVTEAGLSNVATADQTYQPDVRRSYSLMRVTQFVWLVAGVLETLFAVRIILKLLAANPDAGFDRFITGVTAPFLAPFVGLMNNAAASNGSVLEVTTLVAMLVYALLAWGIVRLLWIVFERRVAR